MQFTPEQREEAMNWYADNCLDILALVSHENLSDLLVDVYFKLKTVPFSFRPNQFIIGIDYKSEYHIRKGTESANIRVDNPHKLIDGKSTHNSFALTILMNLLKQLQ